MNKILGLTRFLTVLALLSGQPAAAQAIRVALGPASTPGAYHLQGAFTVSASSEVAWSVLTDYDGIGRFVSSVKESRVLSREPGGAVIEQEGADRFLFVSRRVKLTLKVREKAPGRIHFRDIEGKQFQLYEGTWSIVEAPQGCSVTYELTALPDPSLGPRFAAKKVLKKNAQRLLDEVRAEIKRRAAVRMTS